MKYILAIIIFIVGYAAGNLVPLANILYPKSKIQFAEDFLIKAGTLAKQRHFQGSVLNEPVEINFDANQMTHPKFKKIQ